MEQFHLILMLYLLVNYLFLFVNYILHLLNLYNQDYIIIYFAAEHLLLPTADKTQEEIDKVLDYLTNFSTDTQTVKEEQ